MNKPRPGIGTQRPCRRWFAAPMLLAASLALAQSPPLPTQAQCRELWKAGAAIEPAVEGWCLAIDENKGNCTRCHYIPNRYLPTTLPAAGNLGRVLADLSASYADRADLQQLIESPYMRNPQTVMPAYLRHEILSRDEISLIVTFLLGN